MDRRAKIVATVGPVSSDVETLEKLVRAGVDVIRLNLSHGDHQSHRQVIRNVRQVAEKLRQYVPLFVDLMGPRYRLGKIEGEPRELEEGEIVRLGKAGEGVDLPVEDPTFLEHLRPGERMLIDNGLVELEILAREKGSVRTKVVTPGPVRTRKGINLPDTDLPFTITDKDLSDIHFAVAEKVDYIAVSFVGGPEDLAAVRAVVRGIGGLVPLIAKLERATVTRCITQTVAAADAVMVARGDLGVEVPTHRVPILQKEILTASRRAGKPVIVATQMLESMMEHPRPTRAEASDVANAVFDGADALMLSGETAAGLYPVAAVRTMVEIIKEAEAFRRPEALKTGERDGGRLETLEPWQSERARLNERRDLHLEIPELIASAAVHATERLNVRRIVAFSQGGFTARMIARYRPQAPIVVCTPDAQVARRLGLLWGTHPIRIEQEVHHHDEVVDVVDRLLLEAGLAEPGDVLLILMGDPISERPLTNLMRVHRVRARE